MCSVYKTKHSDSALMNLSTGLANFGNKSNELKLNSTKITY